MPVAALQHDVRHAATRLDARCEHCGQAVPSGMMRAGEAHSFCCHGCETAYSVIHACGLDRFYALLDHTSEPGRPAKESRRSYAEFDDPAFRSLYCRSMPGGLLRVEFLLEGVHCTACVWLVENLPRVLAGVAEARLDIRRASVEVTFDPAQVALSQVGRALSSLGYPPHVARSVGARDAQRAADRRMLVRLAVAGACAGNIMLLFFALYAGMFDGMERGHELILRWIAMGLNTICLLWPGAVFGRSALGALRARTIHLDVPIALGLYLGGAWGMWKVVSATWSGSVGGASDIYFDSISALIFFLIVGRYLQQRQQRAASDALELLFCVTPGVARRVLCAAADGSGGTATSEVATESLEVGDVVEVLAGESVPADGVVVRGSSACDVSILTGESAPITVVPGAPVAAGSVNLESVLRVQVHATGQQTRVGKLMRMVEDASRRRAPILQLADRWGKWLLWALLALSVSTLAIWWHAGPAIAIDHAIALLIATCPCGLGLATPLAMTVAIGRAARKNILVKGGEALQTLAGSHGGTIVLDKTGTITQGRLAVAQWVGDEATAAMVAALEATSSHPVARALARDCASSVHTVPPRDVVQHAGGGIEGTVGGCRVLAGSRALVESRGGQIAPSLHLAAAGMLSRGQSPVFVCVDGQCAGVAAIADPIRADSACAIAAMRARGWRVAILSGDHEAVVSAVASAVGVEPEDCRAGATPEQKLAVVESLARRGPVVMVGDGVNDAGALAAATVGIAVRGGAEASLNAADIAMSRDDGLMPIIDAIDGARHAMRTMHWTIATSLGYNVVAATLSMCGAISPLLAAIIMPASSLTVVALCLRSGAFRTTSRSGGAKPAADALHGANAPTLRRALT